MAFEAWIQEYLQDLVDAGIDINSIENPYLAANRQFSCCLIAMIVVGVVALVTLMAITAYLRSQTV